MSYACRAQIINMNTHGAWHVTGFLLLLLTFLLQCEFYSTSPFCVCNVPDPYKDGQINIWWPHKYENKLIWKKKYIFRGFGSNFQLFLIAWKIKVRK